MVFAFHEKTSRKKKTIHTSRHKLQSQHRSLFYPLGDSSPSSDVLHSLGLMDVILRVWDLKFHEHLHTVVHIEVATGGMAGTRPPPGSKFWGDVPQKSRCLNTISWTFAKIFRFSNISQIKWAKSEEISELGGRWFWLSWIRPPLSKVRGDSLVVHKTSRPRVCLNLLFASHPISCCFSSLPTYTPSSTIAPVYGTWAILSICRNLEKFRDRPNRLMAWAL